MAESRNRVAVARQMASAALAEGDPNGWFEKLYEAADRGEAWVPWARFAPDPHLADWVARHRPAGSGRTAMIVGCGLGDDAELVAGLGFEVTAFDVASTAVAAARNRFPDSAVNYVVADLLQLDARWRTAFDLVVEIYTVQVHRGHARSTAIRLVRDLVAPGGTLLVIARARPQDEPLGPMPWPLTPAELESFATGGLTLVQREEIADPDDGTRFWRATFQRSPDPRAGLSDPDGRAPGPAR